MLLRRNRLSKSNWLQSRSSSSVLLRKRKKRAAVEEQAKQEQLAAEEAAGRSVLLRRNRLSKSNWLQSRPSSSVLLRKS